jgi:hypothetical protein
MPEQFRGSAVFSYNATSTRVVVGTFLGCAVDQHSNPLTEVVGCTVAGCDIGIRGLAHGGTLVIDGCTLRNECDVEVLFSPSAGAGPLPPPGTPQKRTTVRNTDCQGAVKLRLRERQDANVASRVPVLLQVVEVIDSLGLQGAHRAYYAIQHASAPCPGPSDVPPHPFMVRAVCPVDGLSNQEAWAQHGVATGGAVTPQSAVVVAGVIGGLVAKEVTP